MRRSGIARLLLVAVTVAVVAGCAVAGSPAPATPPSTTTGASAAPTTTAAGRMSSATPSATRTASAVSLTTFAGEWVGHTRLLTVSTSGVAHETVSDGCCTPEIDMTFRLANPKGTSAARASATATVAAVTLWALPGRAPTAGTTFTVGLVDGVLTENLSGDTYCDQAAGARSECGA